MEKVTGFVSFDGQFFRAEEDCRAYEQTLRYAHVLRERSELVVRFFKNSDLTVLSELPSPLAKCLEELSEDEMIDSWNQFLMHLFLDKDASLFYEDRAHFKVLHEAPEICGAVTGRDPVAYFQNKVRLAFEVTAYLLEKERER